MKPARRISVRILRLTGRRKPKAKPVVVPVRRAA